MKKEKFICPMCEEGKLKEVQKKICLEFSNPGKIVIETKINECNRCGETFLNEKQSTAFAKKADRLLKHKEEARKIEVREGDILLL